MKTSRYQKIADAAYDRVADGEERFDLAEVTAEIRTELGTETVRDEILDEFAQQLAERADEKRAKRVDSDQYDLLTGEVEALDAMWRLGAGKRVRARHANREELLQWLGIRAANAARVNAAFERDRTAVAELLLFMEDDTTVEQAIEARKKAQP